MSAILCPATAWNCSSRCRASRSVSEPLAGSSGSAEEDDAAAIELTTTAESNDEHVHASATPLFTARRDAKAKLRVALSARAPRTRRPRKTAVAIPKAFRLMLHGHGVDGRRRRRMCAPHVRERRDEAEEHLRRGRCHEEHAKRTYRPISGSSSTSVPAPRGELSRKSVLYLVYTIAIKG